MTVPFLPHAFNTSENLDLEKLNDDLEALSNVLIECQRRRYTYSQARLDLDGVTNASAEVLREIAIRRPGADNALEVYAVEVVIYAAGTEVWTLACSDTSWPSITVTAAGATTEASASSSIPVSITSNSADVRFTMSAGAASTITRGYIIVHLRCDRWNQGGTYTEYFPGLLTSSTSAPATTINSEMSNIASFVTSDADNDKDVRVECYSVRNITSSVTYRAPSGARRVLRVEAYHVGAVGDDVQVDVGGGIDVIQVTVTAAGATVRAVNGTNAGADATQADDPMDSADDLTVVITPLAGTTVLAYVLVWFS